MMRCNEAQEEKIAMRSIKRLSNGISREMCAAFGSGMFSGAQGRTLHFLMAAHTKHDVSFRKILRRSSA